MERFLGLDVHKESSTLAVVGPTGRHGRSIVLDTNGAALTEALRLIPGTKHLCFENCTQAPWLIEILSPLVSSISISMQSIKSEASRDESDAFALAEAVRSGRVTRMPRMRMTAELTRLRILCGTYEKLVTDLVRSKNRVQVLYRSRGVMTPTRNSELYSTAHRDEWLSKAPAVARTAAELLYQEHDALAAIRKRAHREMVAEARKHADFDLLMTCPGIGEGRAAELLATVVTPHRFRTKRQFWSYCGLGIRTRSSADWQKGPEATWERTRRTKVLGLTKSGNRRLKTLFIGAAKSAIHDDAEVRENFERLIAGTTKPPIARLTIARKIAAVTLAVWKSGEAYRPEGFSPKA